MDILDDINKYKKLCDAYSSKINRNKGDEVNSELNARIDQLIKENRENKEKLEMINRISQQVNVLMEQNKDTDAYKNLTNERIEKLVKLFLIINNK